MSKKEVKDETLELIRLVDKDFRNNSFYFLVSLEFGGPLLLFLFVWGFFALYIRSLGPGNLPIPTLLTLTISLLALFFSISAQLDTQRNRLVIARNYYLISRHFSDKTTTEKLHILW